MCLPRSQGLGRARKVDPVQIHVELQHVAPPAASPANSISRFQVYAKRRVVVVMENTQAFCPFAIPTKIDAFRGEKFTRSWKKIAAKMAIP